MQMQVKLLFICLLLISCVSSTKEPAEKNQLNEDEDVNGVAKINENLNISIFLDLSDRISPTKYPAPAMPYHKRDVGYITSVVNYFVDNLSNKRLINMDDDISVFFDPTPANPQINSFSKRLKFSFNKNNVSKEILSKMRTTYPMIVDSIYLLAIKENKYVGSDLWGFIDAKINDYCVKKNKRNILVILTDGYVYHANNIRDKDGKTSYLTPEKIRKERLNSDQWETIYQEKHLGYIQPRIPIKDIEILVIGIKPANGNSREKDVIFRYWDDWMKGMKVKYKLLDADLPTNLEPVINDFLSGK